MEHVQIFDTTLRDGEQSPGISLNTTEKLEIAHQLARLGVDVIEAGFPIASPGDFEAVQAIAREVQRPSHHRPGAGEPGGRRTCMGGRTRRGTTSDPHVRLHVRHPHRPPAAVDARGRQGPGAGGGRAGQGAPGRRRVLADGRDARRRRVHRRGHPDRAGRGRDGHQHPRHRRVHDAARVRRVPDAALRAGARSCTTSTLSVHCHDDLGLAVANSFAGVLAGARQVECAINGIGERAGNASLEEVVMLLRTRGDAVGFDTRVNTQEIARPRGWSRV